MSLIPSYYFDTVAALGVASGESIEFVATAFIFAHASPTSKDDYWYFIVTNRHVVEQNQELWIRFNSPRDAEPFPYPILAAPPSGWLFHPDPDVDLAIIPVDSVDMPRELLPRTAFLNDRHVASLDELRSSEFSEGNDVYVLGFPLGIAGNVQNDVIVRHGIVARIQDWYEERTKGFLIDSFVFPGNSGGPVILKPVLESVSHKTMITRSRLIGLVASYQPYREVALGQQTGNVRLVSEENSGLANVVPIDSVIQLTTNLIHLFEMNASADQPVGWASIKLAIDSVFEQRDIDEREL